MSYEYTGFKPGFLESIGDRMNHWEIPPEMVGKKAEAREFIGEINFPVLEEEAADHRSLWLGGFVYGLYAGIAAMLLGIGIVVLLVA